MWRLRGEVVPLGVVIRSLCLFLSLFKQVTCWVSQARIEVIPCQCALPKQPFVVQNAAPERMPAQGRAFQGELHRDICDRSDGIWWLRTQSRAQLDRSRDYCLSPVGVTPLVDRKSGCWTGSLSLAHGLSSEPWFPNRWNDGDEIRDGYGEYRQPGRCSWISVISPHSQDPRVIPLWLRYINTFKINFPLK